MPLLKPQERDEIQKRLQTLSGPVQLIFFKQSLHCDTCAVTESLLREIAGLSDHIQLETYNVRVDEEKAREYGVEKVPAIVMAGPAGARVRFYGIPSGYEFAAFLEGLKAAASGRADISAETQDTLGMVNKPVHIQVFVTPTCPFCPSASITASRLALASPLISTDIISANEFPELSHKYGVQGVPMVVMNDSVTFAGALPEPDFARAAVRAAA